ncbi:hypothetical protein ACLS0M_05065 [Avibacterium avium]|uniref:hypothetical protein n=1 Tax=Avibacterium avium TaxID=751 RepID=UPI003BF7D814
MLNIFKKPYEKGTLAAWAKISDDIAKVVFFAIPVMIYGNDSLPIKLLNIALLTIGIYLFILAGRLCRRAVENRNEEE